MTTGPESATPNQDAQNAGYLAGLAALGNVNAYNDNGNRQSSSFSSATSKQKLTYESAKALLFSMIDAVDFVGKLTPDDVKQFMNEFNAEQDKQIAKVTQSASSKTTAAGITPDAAKKVVESTAKTEYPSFFKPEDFAKDFLWKKISFQDDATLGAKSLGILGQVRGLVDAFNMLGVSDKETRRAAELIAKGKMTINEYNVELQKIAIKEYPQFADRFAKDPSLTVYDIASPVINMVAKTFEVDPKTIGMNHPLVRAYTHYAGADGKGKPPSFYELQLKAKAMPEYQYTEEANTNARSAASALGSAMGFGG